MMGANFFLRKYLIFYNLKMTLKCYFDELTTGKKVRIELKVLFNYWRRFGIYNPLLMPKSRIYSQLVLDRKNTI
jgi:hypothetical protein